MSAEEILEKADCVPTDVRATHWLDPVCRRWAFGQLQVRFPNDRSALYQGRFAGESGVLEIRHPWRLALRLLTRGEIGFAESFIHGHWDSPDLPALLETLSMNLEHLGVGPQSARWTRLWDRLVHGLHRNHRHNSRRNIARHYDLGNDFYRCWLDEGMTYSSALFSGAADEPLEVAQARKYARLLDALDARPGEHVLEIGCGWGGFAEAAARRGLRVTALTLSREQLDYARARLAAAGLSDRVEVRLQDYRDVSGSFDHAVSIEMLEAVGEAYWPVYFGALRRLVRPGGRIALQVIVLHEDDYELYRRTPDFIQLYIFPGGMLPTVSRLDEEVQGAGLRMRRLQTHGEDYAETLRRWRERFVTVTEQIATLGYDARFRRMWKYYLAYCEAGFRNGCVDLAQTLLEVPREAHTRTS